MQFKKLSRGFGVEVKGLSCDMLLGSEAGAVKQAVADHQLVVIRDVPLGNDAFLELAKNFGKPIKPTFSSGIDGYPEIIEIVRTPETKGALSIMWHSDSTYLRTPPGFTLLIGDEVPEFGTITSFCNTAEVYKDLSPAFQDILNSAKFLAASDAHALNDRYSYVSNPTRQKAEVERYSAMQDVLTRVGNEQRGILLNEEHAVHLDGFTQDESKGIFDVLFSRMKQDRYRATVQWEVGTIVISDNRTTQHRAHDDCAGYGRKLRRIIVE